MKFYQNVRLNCLYAILRILLWYLENSAGGAAYLDFYGEIYYVIFYLSNKNLFALKGSFV